jgi:glutamate--cysteine ligase
VGLLYDEESLQGALDIISDWTDQERATLRRKVPQQGLQVPFRDGLLKHVAQDVYKLSKDGLLRRGYKEVGFLNEIEETVRTGVTPAERLLKLYDEKWGKNIDPVFDELLYWSLVINVVVFGRMMWFSSALSHLVKVIKPPVS